MLKVIILCSVNGDDGPCHDVVQFYCFLLYFERFILVCHVVLLPVSSRFPPSWLSSSVPHYPSAYLVRHVFLSFCCQFVSVRSSCSRPRSCLEFPALYSVCAGFCFVFPQFVVFPSACQLFIKTCSLFHHLLAWSLHFGLFFFFCYNLTVLERHQHESQSHDITTAWLVSRNEGPGATTRQQQQLQPWWYQLELFKESVQSFKIE